jgi:phosphatidylglycerol:prolipoprotein diacylglycerol transferase
MYPILFKLGGFTFYTHGLLAVLGIIFGSAVLYFLAKKSKLKTEFLFDNIVWSVLFGIIGARITYFVLYREQFATFKEIFYLWDGGMVSLGGFILGYLAFVFLIRSQKDNLAKWLSLGSISFALGLAIGRIGNIFAGEYAGVRTLDHFNIQGFVPVNMYESLLLFLIFGLFFLFRNISIARKIDGFIFTAFWFAYSLGRFIIDFWSDEKRLFWHISFGQTVCLAICLVSIYFIIKMVTDYSRKEKHAAV